MDIISYNVGATANGRIEIINANPDSTSGIVTVPKTIASGETVTIPSGRVAVLPNVTVDGDLVVEAGGEIFVPAGANFSDLDQRIDTLDNTTVKLTGDQTVGGIKTFTSSPIVPVPTTDFQTVPLRSTNITVDVGAGQTYTTINQALEYLSGFYPMYKKSGITATINLKAGFVMAEQVLVRGIDLGWITIVGEDAETVITHTALTTNFTGADYAFTSYPAFGVSKGGVSPRIGQLFRFNVEKVGGEKHGIMAIGAGSSAEVLVGKGFIGAGYNGIYALVGSIVFADSANISNAGINGIYADSGAIISANRVNVSNAGSSGIRSSGCSIISAYMPIAQNQTTGLSCVSVAAGGTVIAPGIDTTGGTVPVLSQVANTLTGNGIIYQ